MSFFKIRSPLARKRLQNFLQIRRAVISLWLLVALFLISLISELICNSKPLYVRYDGRSFFPFIQHLTQKDLDPKSTSVHVVDWKSFVASKQFTANPKNKAVWTVVPFGPEEVVNPDSLEKYRKVRVSVVPESRIGRLDLFQDGTIVRPVSCAPFFPGLKTIEKSKIGDYWKIPDAMKKSLQARLAGRAVPSERFLLEYQPKDRKIVAEALLPPLPARSPRPMVRLQLRDPDAVESPFTIHLRKAKDGTLTGWGDREIPSAVREKISEFSLTCMEGQALPTQILPWKDGRNAKITCVLTRIAWPFEPVPEHWMGVDAAGRDVFSRVLYGMRIALIFGLALALWSMFFGILIGSIQGYFGGWVDLVGQRLTEIWSALPFLYVMIFVGSALGRGFLILLICYGLFNWIVISYYMRAEFLRLRQRTFVEAARCQGLSPIRIIFMHILPNALTPLITLFPFNLMGAIGSLAALDFLGFGLPPMTPSWGELLHQAQLFRWAWWLILFPSIALFVVMLLSVLVGEGLRDAFDPRQQSHIE